ncbi:helix-turn-helix domain-containing protein [Cupriavidus basilensis]
MSDQPLSSWQYMPGPPLARLRSWGCTLSGFSEDLGRTVRRVEVVSPRIKVVIGFGAGYLLGAGKNQRRHQAFVVGNPAGPTTVEHDDAQSCVEVELPPWAAYSLFDGASDVLAGGVVDLADIWGSEAGLLAEALHGAPAWERRFEIVEQLLARRLVAPRRAVPAALRWAWEELAREQGASRSGNCATGSDGADDTSRLASRGTWAWVRRPRRARIRFGSAHGLMSLAPGMALSQVAAACGYSDQSHFTREFQAFAGCSPAAYAQAGFPDAPGKPASLLEA